MTSPERCECPVEVCNGYVVSRHVMADASPRRSMSRRADCRVQRTQRVVLHARTCPDELLLDALLTPLRGSQRLFGPEDPWRQRRRLSQLCEWLAVRTQPAQRPPTEARASQPVAANHPALRVATEPLTGRGLTLSGTSERGGLLLREDAHAAVLYPAHRSNALFVYITILPIPVIARRVRRETSVPARCVVST